MSLEGERASTAWPSRDEVEAAVSGAFTCDQPTREDVVVAALRAAARPAVIALLRGLPPQRFRGLEELWAALPDLADDGA